MSQPLTIKNKWSTHNGHKMSCELTPDKGTFSPECVLAYTILYFERKLLVQWDKDNKSKPNYLNKKFELFAAAFTALLSQSGTFVLPSMNETSALGQTSRIV